MGEMQAGSNSYTASYASTLVHLSFHFAFQGQEALANNVLWHSYFVLSDNFPQKYLLLHQTADPKCLIVHPRR